jgi:hypothetical protein
MVVVECSQTDNGVSHGGIILAQLKCNTAPVGPSQGRAKPIGSSALETVEGDLLHVVMILCMRWWAVVLETDLLARRRVDFDAASSVLA